MPTITIDLDDETLERISRLAETSGCTPELLIRAAVKQFSQSKPIHDPLIGMFADEPDLIDEIVEEAMRARGRPCLGNGVG